MSAFLKNNSSMEEKMTNKQGGKTKGKKNRDHSVSYPIHEIS
jgi:hypothetical protein